MLISIQNTYGKPINNNVNEKSTGRKRKLEARYTSAILQTHVVYYIFPYYQ